MIILVTCVTKTSNSCPLDSYMHRSHTKSTFFNSYFMNHVSTYLLPLEDAKMVAMPATSAGKKREAGSDLPYLEVCGYCGCALHGCPMSHDHFKKRHFLLFQINRGILKREATHITELLMYFTVRGPRRFRKVTFRCIKRGSANIPMH